MYSTVSCINVSSTEQDTYLIKIGKNFSSIFSF